MADKKEAGKKGADEAPGVAEAGEVLMHRIECCEHGHLMTTANPEVAALARMVHSLLHRVKRLEEGQALLGGRR